MILCTINKENILSIILMGIPSVLFNFGEDTLMDDCDSENSH